MNQPKPPCDCEQYIRRIHHAGKKQYARALHEAILKGKPRPQPRAFGLSIMGAQAVELELGARHGNEHAARILGIEAPPAK